MYCLLLLRDVLHFRIFIVSALGVIYKLLNMQCCGIDHIMGAGHMEQEPQRFTENLNTLQTSLVISITTLVILILMQELLRRPFQMLMTIGHLWVLLNGRFWICMSGWNLRVCIFFKLPGDADAAFLKNTFWKGRDVDQVSQTEGSWDIYSYRCVYIFSGFFANIKKWKTSTSNHDEVTGTRLVLLP